MITDIFLRRYPEYKLEITKALFVQLFNIYDDHHIGIHSALLDKVEGYTYSGFADEHIRIIVLSMQKFCHELGCENLDKSEYTQPDWGFSNYRIFKNYVFDESILPIEKISFFEILFRDTAEHFLSEIEFLKNQIPEYEEHSLKIQELSKIQNTKYYDGDNEKLKKAKPQLERKILALEKIQDNINQRLKLNKAQLSYHNGYFQNSTDSVIEEQIAAPFWKLISEPKYKNVETDMLQAIYIYDSNGRDPAFYAAKALESMLKIICEDKKIITGEEKLTSHYIDKLNSAKNGTIIINHEKEELLSMFRIRNTRGGHGPGSEEMLTLNSQQTLRYIHAAMVWISNLAIR